MSSSPTEERKQILITSSTSHKGPQDTRAGEPVEKKTRALKTNEKTSYGLLCGRAMISGHLAVVFSVWRQNLVAPGD